MKNLVVKSHAVTNCGWIFLFLISTLFANGQQAQDNREAESVTVIRAGSLIDGKSDKPRPDQVIIVRGNRIESVGDAASAKIPPGAKVVDLSKAIVLPGLIDSHTHIFLQGEDPAQGGYDANILNAPLALRAARATVAVRRALEQGFTTLRDVETEGAGYGDVGIKQAIEQGYIPGPRLFVSTRAISTTGGYQLEGYAPELEMPKGAQIVDGPVEARKAAREQLDHGADWIKVYMTHRSWEGKHGELVSQPTLTVDELRAIVDETHGWGKKVACHAYSGIGLHRALDGAATPSSMAWIWMMRRLPRWLSKAPGMCQRSGFITRTGLRRRLRRDDATGFGLRCTNRLSARR